MPYDQVDVYWSVLDAQQIKMDIHKKKYNTLLCLHSPHTSFRYHNYSCYFSSSSNLYTEKVCIRLYEVVLLLLENKRKWFSINGLWQWVYTLCKNSEREKVNEHLYCIPLQPKIKFTKQLLMQVWISNLNKNLRESFTNELWVVKTALLCNNLMHSAQRKINI